MNIDVDMAVKPVRRLRKLLKEIPPEFAPEFVHDVRTQSRKLEAAVHVLSRARDRRALRLLRLVKPVRRAAGKVRDLDVMIEKLFALGPEAQEPGSDALLQLTEDMAAKRRKGADRLERVLRRQAKPLRSKLKSYRRQMKKADAGELAEGTAAPQMLALELQHWPRLRAGNLHEFRIHAKELRYMLQLTPQMDAHTLDAFARVKDVAGEWHDWLQLREYAAAMVDGRHDPSLLRRLGAIEREKLRAALAAANAVRHNGLAAI